MTDKICIIIPAFNEEASLGGVIESIKKINKNYTIVVVNDGSNDNTSLIALKHDVVLLDLPFNLGVGAAVQTGLIFAKDNNYNVAIRIDADGQHQPKYIPNLIKQLKTTDVVIGSRFVENTDYKTSLTRLLATKIYSTLIKIVYGVRIYDPISGYLAFNKRSINLLLRDLSGEESDIIWIIKMIINKYGVKEVPAKMLSRKYGKSYFGIFNSIYIIISLSISILIETYKEKLNYKNYE